VNPDQDRSSDLETQQKSAALASADYWAERDAEEEADEES
jgi:hypothetical protein